MHTALQRMGGQADSDRGAPSRGIAAHLEAGCDISQADKLLHGLGRVGVPDCIDLCLGCALHVLVACQVVHRVAENWGVIIYPIQERQHLHHLKGHREAIP